MSDASVNRDPGDELRRRIRRNALALGLLALGIYVAFIASGMLGARG